MLSFITFFGAEGSGISINLFSSVSFFFESSSFTALRVLPNPRAFAL